MYGFFVKLFCRIKIVYLHLRAKQNEMKKPLKILAYLVKLSIIAFIIGLTMPYASSDIPICSWKKLIGFVFIYIPLFTGYEFIIKLFAESFEEDEPKEGKS